MRALLARRVDVAWLLLVAALSGAVLVLWLAMQSAATPGGQVYVVRAAATSIAGQGGAPDADLVAGASATPSRAASPEAPQRAALPPTTVTSSPVATASSVQPTPYPTTPTLPAGARLDLNRATADELESLPGIGPVLAARIVRDREANGPFATVDDLKRVDGIGDGIVGKVRDHVTVNP